MTEDRRGAALAELGWDEHFAEAYRAAAEPGDVPGRVIATHKNRFVVACAEPLGELDATLGRRLDDDHDPAALPATGDWVALRVDDEARGGARVRAVLPRRTAFLRQAAGRATAAQVVAANVDRAFVVAALPDGVNPRRLERYLAMAWESGAIPVVVLTKADLAGDDLGGFVAAARAVSPGVDVVAVSSLGDEDGGGDDAGVAPLRPHLAPGTTVVLLGPSGAGKSTLLNRLVGREVMRTAEVRDRDGKGRHTTTHRELVRLPGGALVIDTPGMRELQLWGGGTDAGIAQAFDDVAALAAGCRFGDCQHAGEPGCAVAEAVARGELAPERLESWRKLSREMARAARQQDALAMAADRARVKSLTRAGNAWIKRKRQ